MSKPLVRRQDPYVALTKEQFRERFFSRFYDPIFEEVAAELDKVFHRAWDGYIEYRKSPRQLPAGPEFADPLQALPIEWLETRARIAAARARQQDSRSPSRILIINGSFRSEHSCPGEISKTRRLAQAAQSAIESLPGHEVDFLDLSTLADEPWKVIHPCKACVSTAMPLCTGRARATRTTRSVKPTTGWPKSIPDGSPPTASSFCVPCTGTRRRRA